MIRPRAPLTSLTLRQSREALRLSQANFAAQLGVSLETYRTWDSGRRPVRLEMLTRANELALRHNPHELLSFETLARLIHVHVRTLHAAAHGRAPPRHLRHADDVSSAPIACDARRCGDLPARVFRESRMAEGAAGAINLEADPARLCGPDPACATTTRPKAKRNSPHVWERPARPSSANGNHASVVRPRCPGSEFGSSAPQTAISKHYAANQG
jgi:transcriptional regulator with XRE-family HTH domain